MRLTDRDKLVLARSVAALSWFGLLCWTLYHSRWLGLAFTLYIILDRRVFSKYWGPESLRGEGL